MVVKSKSDKSVFYFDLDENQLLLQINSDFQQI